ncbi:MAG TPA: twin-arginine translocation signal domain-containing protein, partial [Chromatiaceae bacterium]|nr:twin-arginine translocation signal domain-containing protein [Chromatiaceae bacterium]
MQRRTFIKGSLAVGATGIAAGLLVPGSV